MAVMNEILLSKTINANRIDAERFKPAYVENEAKLLRKSFNRLKTYMQEIAGGATPKGANYIDSGIPFVRVQNIRENKFDFNDLVFISEKIHNGQLKRSQIKPLDVLFTITGVSYGNAAVAYQEILPANMNQHSVRIALNNDLIPEFLSTFLICQYGRLQSDSKITGDTRPALTYPEIGNLIIPLISFKEQSEIKRIVRDSFEKIRKSFDLYAQAQQFLERELGLDKLIFDKPLSYEARLSEVVGNNRADADYYQPMYETIWESLRQFDIIELNKVCSQINYGTVPTSPYKTTGVPYIKGLNLKDTFVTTDKLDFLDTKSTQILDDKYFVRQNDIIISQMGSVGFTGIVQEDQEGWLFASFTIKARLKKETNIDPNYLSLYINNVARPYYIMRKIAQASVRQNTDLPTLRKLPIVLLPIDKQKHIGNLLREYKKTKIKSQQLLEQAKRRVEELVEEAVEK